MKLYFNPQEHYLFAFTGRIVLHVKTKKWATERNNQAKQLSTFLPLNNPIKISWVQPKSPVKQFQLQLTLKIKRGNLNKWETVKCACMCVCVCLFASCVYVCVRVCVFVTRCINIYNLSPNECADVDLKANITEDEIMSLWFQGAGGKHAWTNKDSE